MSQLISVDGAPSRPGGAPAHRLDIQGLRAIAVLSVVGYHAGLPIHGGFVGVDIFFVVSGYVITAMLQREWARSGRIDFGRFYLRRFKRLTPALALVVILTALISAVVLWPLGAQQQAAQTGLGAMGLVANFVIALTTGAYFDAPAETNPLLNTWSLSVEEQFYIVFPALIALGWGVARRRANKQTVPVALVTGLAIVSFALAVAGSYGLTVNGSTVAFGFYSPVSRAWEFAIGALLVLAPPRLPSGRRLTEAMGATGLVMIALSFVVIRGSFPFPGLWALLPDVGTLLVLLAGGRGDALATSWLAWKPLVKIGDWSYSIYLWHWPFIVFATYLWPEVLRVAAIAAVASLVPALLSYHFVEQPIRLLKDGSGRRTAGLVAVVVLPAVLISGGVLLVDRLYWEPRYAAGAVPVANTGDVGQDAFMASMAEHSFPCTPVAIREQANSWNGVLRCQQSKQGGGIEVALIGDSHSEHLYPGLAEALPSRNVVYYAYGDLPVASDSAQMMRILEEVRASRSIKVVVISDFWAIRSIPVPELARTLTDLRDSGKTVFVTDDVPSFPMDPVQCKLGKSPLLKIPSCSINQAIPEGRYQSFYASLQRAVDAVPGVVLVKTFNQFCGDGACSMASKGELLYRDNDHLNLNGSRFVAQVLLADPAFKKAVDW